MQAQTVEAEPDLSTPRLWGGGEGQLGMARNMGRPSWERQRGNRMVGSKEGPPASDKLHVRLSSDTYILAM